MESICASVAVVGGGPAGSSLARKLALLGHSVVLVEKTSFPRTHIGESLPSSIVPLLDSLGIRNRIENGDFLRPRDAIVHWAGIRRRVRSQEQPGFQVDRPRFDAMLLHAAREAGTVIFQPAKIESIEPGWRIRVQTPNGPLTIHADFLADAAGRACLTGGRRVFHAPPLLALCAYWQMPREFGIETRVESGSSEWFWGAPLPDSSFNATVLVEPKRLANFRRAELYRSLIRNSSLLRESLSTKQLTEVVACDATSFRAEEMISPVALKVGEAAFTIDPLSSQGLQVAMGSALHAAAVIHTMFARPNSMRIAMEFYRDRQTGASLLHEESALEFYEEAASFHKTLFWMRRSKENLSRIARRDVDPRCPLPAPDLMLTQSATLVTKNVPCLCNEFIEERQGLVCERSRRPLVFWGNVAVVPLWRQISWPTRASHLVRTWAPHIGQQVALEVLAKLWQDGYVEVDRGHTSLEAHSLDRREEAGPCTTSTPLISSKETSEQ